MPKHLTVTDAAGFVSGTQVGAANGVAPLGADSKIPATFLPSSTALVASVNGKTGAVLLTSTDVGAVASSTVGNANGVAPLDSSGRLPVAKLPLSAVQTVNGYMGPSVTLAASDVGAMTQTTADGRYMRQGSIVLNVMDYGALADDATDASPAIQAAVNAAQQGDVVYIPPGKYRLASTIVVSLGVVLRGGGWNPHFAPRTNMTRTYLRPGVGNFSGTELIRIDPAPVNGSYLDSAYGGGPRVEGLALSGKLTNNVGGQPIVGIKISSGVKDAQIRQVSIWQFTGDGMKTDDVGGMVFDQVVSTTNGGIGFNIMSSSGTAGATDLDMINCYSQGNGGDGFVLNNPNAVKMTGCRSEFNAGYGYNLSGICYSLAMIGCNTDRSGKHGFHITCVDGGKLPLLIGCQAKRDGSSAGTWAGFNLQGTNGSVQSPGAVFEGCSVYVGVNDDGSGNRSPAYGVQTNFTRRVSISGGWIEGTSSAYNDTSIAISKTSGVIQVTVDPSTGVQTISNSDRADINGSSGATKALRYFTRGGGERWEARSNSTSESGSNAGSDYDIARFSDAGSEIDVPFRITRSTGIARFLKTPTLNGTSITALGWVNVLDHGAVGDGTTDDKTAIQNALNACGLGGIVYLPPKVYALSNKITIPPYVTLMGTLADRDGNGDGASCLLPKAGFTGSTVIDMVDQTTGGYATTHRDATLVNVTIDGRLLTTESVQGITATGYVHGVQLRNVSIHKVTGHAISHASNASGSPFSWYMENVQITGAGAVSTWDGFHLISTDHQLVNCRTLGVRGYGYYMSGGANCQLVACRAEWSTKSGFYITGSWGTAQGSGGLLMDGCSTDRNSEYGVLIDATGNASILVSGLSARRDGRNGFPGTGGGGFAALRGNNATTPIVVTGMTCYPGVGDDGTGVNSPERGASFTGCTYASVEASYLHADSTPFHDGGSNTALYRGVAVGTATGPTSAPVRSLVGAGNLPGPLTLTQGGYTVVRGAATNTLLDGRQTSDTVARYNVTAGGTHAWSTGSATADTNLKRQGTGVVGTDNTLQATTGLQIGSASTDFGGGVGAIGIKNASTAPTTNPTGGGILYVEGGVAKVRQSDGTIVVIQNPPVTSVASKTGAVTLVASDVGAVATTAVGAASGVASLDSGTKVPVAQIPDLSATYATVAAYGNTWMPSDHGLISWTMDPGATSASGTPLSAGFIYMLQVVLRQAATISKINLVLGAAGATLTANQCLAGLYNTAGTRVGITADMSTTWNSAGNKTMNLTSSFSAAAGKYYIALVFNGTTSPTFACGSTLGATFTPGNANLAAGTYRWCRSASGQTTLPTSVTLSGYTPDANNIYAAVG